MRRVRRVKIDGDDRDQQESGVERAAMGRWAQILQIAMLTVAVAPQPLTQVSLSCAAHSLEDSRRY